MKVGARMQRDAGMACSLRPSIFTSLTSASLAPYRRIRGPDVRQAV